MKILLINTSISGSNPEELHMREPLGLAYLAAVLRDAKLEVAIFDFYALGKGKAFKEGNKYRKGLSDMEILRALDAVVPDIIGVSCNFTIYSEDSYNVARLCREKYKNSLIVLGGAHASTLAEEDLLNNEYLDVIVKGEGESTLLEISKRLKEGHPLDDIKGTLIKKEKNVIVNLPRERIYDLDSIPFPARDLLDMNFYLSQSDIYGHIKQIPAAVIFTSRGCPFDCVFCSVKSTWTRNWRSHSPERVLKEMSLLIKDYGVREFYIYDDNFIVDKKRCKEICRLINENNLKISITIPSGMSVHLIDDELLRDLIKAGLYRVVFPIETGCEKTLEFTRKKVDLVDAKRKIKLCNRLGLWTSGNFLIGFPFEKEEDILTTIEYAEHSGLDFVFYFAAQPYVGSDLNVIYKKEGLLKNYSVDTKSKALDTKYDTKYLTAERIQFLRDSAASRYLKLRLFKYLNPLEFFTCLFPKINSWEKFKYALKLLNNQNFLKLVFNKQKI